MLIGCALLGVAPAVLTSACSLISVTWFPVYQRATATSIAALGAPIGYAFGFIFGKVFVIFVL